MILHLNRSKCVWSPNSRVLWKMNMRAVYQVTLLQCRVRSDGGCFGTFFFRKQEKEKWRNVWREGEGWGDAGRLVCKKNWKSCVKKAIFILCVTRSHAVFVFIVVVPINLLAMAGQIISYWSNVILLTNKMKSFIGCKCSSYLSSRCSQYRIKNIRRSKNRTTQCRLVSGPLNLSAVRQA